MSGRRVHNRKLQTDEKPDKQLINYGHEVSRRMRLIVWVAFGLLGLIALLAAAFGSH